MFSNPQLAAMSADHSAFAKFVQDRREKASKQTNQPLPVIKDLTQVISSQSRRG